MLGPLSSYFFGDQLFRFDMWKEDWKTSNHFCNFNTFMINIIIFQSISDIVVVFFSYVITNMSSLNLYGYNLEKLIQLIKMFAFLFNLEQIPRSFRKALGI